MSEQIIPLSSEDFLCDIPTIAQNEAALERKRQEAAQERGSKNRSSKKDRTVPNTDPAEAPLQKPEIQAEKSGIIQQNIQTFIINL